MIRKKPSIRKRSFLLLELLISLALVACCLFPMVKPHMAIHQEERKELKKMQLEMHAERAFCLLKEKLYERHAWETLQKAKGNLDFDSDVYLGKEKHHFTCTYKLSVAGRGYKKDPTSVAKVLNAKFKFVHGKDKEVFHRTLFVEQISEEAT